MSEKPSGYGTMQLGGQERPFHVGTNQGEIFASLQNRRGEDGGKMSLQAYGELFGVENLRANRLSGGDVRDFVYSALVAGYENDGLRVDFSAGKVGNWIDDADAEEVAKPFAEMMGQMVKRMERQAERLKNAQAPTTPKGPKKAKAKPSAGPA